MVWKKDIPGHRGAVDRSAIAKLSALINRHKQADLCADITLESSWHKLFGNKIEDYTAEERMARWYHWLGLANRSADYADPAARESADYWSEPGHPCTECKHLNHDWCTLQHLPATVNMILTPKTHEKGLACMGTGFEPKDA